MPIKPTAFLCYVHFDDEYEDGRLSEFRQRLSGEVRIQTGDEFPIFQDRNDIGWGKAWKARIDQSLDAATFLIPILTPSFFKSTECRRELTQFLERETKLRREDLILPVYYVTCPVLDEEAKRKKNRLARVLASRQYADLRELRFEPFTSSEVRRMLSRLAAQIRAALAEIQEDETKSPAGKPRRTTAAKPARTRTRKPARPRSPEAKAVAASQEAAGRGPGPAPKTEPPLLIVDPLHRGDHATISAAIDAANPGDRIVVRPGLYEEGLVIDKQLEIIGEGERSEIVVRAEGQNAVLFRTTMGRVANLTLHQAGGASWYGVDIAQGRLELDGCDIASESLACVAIHDGADPRLRRNRIHDGKAGGVFVYESGQGTLEDNDIFGNVFAGVEIKTGGNPTLLRNRIHDGKTGGVFVSEGGQGTLEDNDLRENAKGAWSVSDDSEVIRDRNLE